MALYGNNKRDTGRVKRELRLELRTGNSTKQVYTIDLSPGGVKLGAQMLQLAVGERVELSLDIGGKRHFFSGTVARDDGAQRINRIGRDANSFFIKVTDDTFPSFVKSSFNV
jgi:hypothetical protein